jgi:uncharacterized protein (DUF924 family)/alkylated DNA repair dioxygenase AlkB
MNHQHFGDTTAVRLANENIEYVKNPTEIGSGDTSIIHEFLTKEEADESFAALKDGGEIKYQQWHHMPDKKHKLLPLSRLKIAMADVHTDGWMPHYRFPVNNQDHHGVFPFDISLAVSKIKEKLIAFTGIPFNHAVVLLYRDGKDCIGFHKDKTLDLSDTSPIASISLGQPRSYLLRDMIHQPKKTQEMQLTHGSLLLLGPQTNRDWYHSVPMEPDAELSPRVSITFRVVTTFKHTVTGELKGQGAGFATYNWPNELGGSHIDYYDEVLDFWLGAERREYRSGLWWHGIYPQDPQLRTQAALDEFIANKWGKLLEAYFPEKPYNLWVDNHLLKWWMESVDELMALLLLFDQCSRHVYRGTSRAFVFDNYAWQIAQHLLLVMEKEMIPISYKFFVYVAMMHQEDIGIVNEATLGLLKFADLYRSLIGEYRENDENAIHEEAKAKEDYKWMSGLKRTAMVCEEHLVVLQRFGRYPHRNAILNRVSNLEEIDFLSSSKLPK